jgi:hypothetical protein
MMEVVGVAASAWRFLAFWPEELLSRGCLGRDQHCNFPGLHSIGKLKYLLVTREEVSSDHLHYRHNIPGVGLQFTDYRINAM